MPMLPATIPAPVAASSSAALVELLQQARAANPSDPRQVERCLRRAVQLLHPRPPTIARTSPRTASPAAGDGPAIPQEAGEPDAEPGTGKVATLPLGGLSLWQVRRVRAHIASNLAGRLPVRELAAEARLSTGYFIRAFRASFGTTPRAFIMQQRVARAKALMLATRQPLAEVALNCGLSDQAHFSRLFRRFEGRSPAAWRREAPGGAAAAVASTVVLAPHPSACPTAFPAGPMPVLPTASLGQAVAKHGRAGPPGKGRARRAVRTVPASALPAS